MKVYVVTRGTYSDYHILATFTDKGLADRFAEVEAGQTETYEAFERMPEKVTWWVIDTIHYDHPGEPFERTTDYWEFEDPAYNGREYEYSRWGNGHRRVYGRDPERVRKVFWDNWHRERAVAEGIG